MRSAQEAVAASRRWTTNSYGMCLYTVQTWLAAPWSGPWAEDAWHRWGGHHPGDMNPPPGVPVYWHNPRSKYGHIALSVGGGRIRSTDWPGARRVGELTIPQMTAAWNIQYLGWADRFSGGTIQGIGQSHQANKTYLSKLKRGQRNSESVKNLQRALKKAFPHAPAAKRLPVTGTYGKQTAFLVFKYKVKRMGQDRAKADRDKVGAEMAKALRLPNIVHDR